MSVIDQSKSVKAESHEIFGRDAGGLTRSRKKEGAWQGLAATLAIYLRLAINPSLVPLLGQVSSDHGAS